MMLATEPHSLGVGQRRTLLSRFVSFWRFAGLDIAPLSTEHSYSVVSCELTTKHRL